MLDNFLAQSSDFMESQQPTMSSRGAGGETAIFGQTWASCERTS